MLHPATGGWWLHGPHGPLSCPTLFHWCIGVDSLFGWTQHQPNPSLSIYALPCCCLCIPILFIHPPLCANLLLSPSSFIYLPHNVTVQSDVSQQEGIHNYLSTHSDLVITTIIETTQPNTALLHTIMASYGLNANPKNTPTAQHLSNV